MRRNHSATARTSLLAVLTFLGAALSAQAASRVATVDMALVFKSYPEVIKTTYFLKQKKDEYQEEIDKERRKIEGITEDAKKQNADAKELQELENKKRRMLFELQTKFQRYKEKLQELEQEEFEKIRDNVKSSLAKLARSRRFDMVIEKQWLYFGETEDLTAALITSLGGEVPPEANR